MEENRLLVRYFLDSLNRDCQPRTVSFTAFDKTNSDLLVRVEVEHKPDRKTDAFVDLNYIRNELGAVKSKNWTLTYSS